MRWLWKIPGLGSLIFHLWKLDARRKYRWIAPHLGTTTRLVEIGSGPGSVVSVFRRAGHDVVAIDITDTSYCAALRPVLYDGTRLPFADASFDGALILTTLHHTMDPDALLREAARVARRIYIVEDIFISPSHRIITKLADAITNLEFFGHPHNNRDDPHWRATFRQLNLTLRHVSEKPMAGYFLQILYVLDPPTSDLVTSGPVTSGPATKATDALSPSRPPHPVAQ